MEQEVYVDILFLINLSMDYLCLYVCARILHRKIRLWRLISASVLGGIYSVLSLFFLTSPVLALIIDVAVCFLMCLIAYYEKARGFPSLLLSTFLFVGVSMMTGGCMTAIFNLLNKLDLPLGSLSGDGISTYLFAFLALIAGIISLKGGQAISRRSSVKECKLYMRFCDTDFELLGLSDSGNLVRDPISGKAVIFLDRETLEKKVSLSFMDDFQSGTLDSGKKSCGLRLIAINTASGKAMTVAAAPEILRAEITEGRGKSREIVLDALISPSPQRLSDSGYNAIIPSEILK